MKLTPAILIARKVAGYRPPVEDAVCCKTCGAIRFRPAFSYERYYCRKHMFYVHSRGVCPKWQKEPYTPPAPPKPPFVQEELTI